MFAKLIVGTALFLFGGAAIHQGLTWVAQNEVAATTTAVVQSAPTSVVTPTSQFAVYDYAVIVCVNGLDVTIDKTEPVLLVTCE